MRQILFRTEQQILLSFPLPFHSPSLIRSYNTTEYYGMLPIVEPQIFRFFLEFIFSLYKNFHFSFSSFLIRCLGSLSIFILSPPNEPRIFVGEKFTKLNYTLSADSCRTGKRGSEEKKFNT